MEEVNRIDKTNLNQLSFLILSYLLATCGLQKQNKEKNNLKHKREKWTTKRGIEGRTTRHTRIKDSGCSGGSRGRESAKPRRRK